MKKYAWTEAALLFGLPLCAAVEISHDHPLSGVVLIAAAFSIIIRSCLGARRESKRKHENLQVAARNDGKYIAEYVNNFGDLQTPPPGLPADFLPRFEAELAEASDKNPLQSGSEDPGRLGPWQRPQTHTHFSKVEQQSKEIRVDGVAHCGEQMKLVRTIPKTGMLPELYMFKCVRCGHVKTQEQYPISVDHSPDYFADSPSR
jgi:hypothetical protein